MCADVVKNHHDTPVSIISVKQVQALLGISRTTIWRKTHDPDDGSFPVPVRLSHKSIGFYAHEIEAYLLSLPRVITNKLGVNHEE
jgi:predicted DNA-binding transcriptional regulator AlpA